MNITAFALICAAVSIGGLILQQVLIRLVRDDGTMDYYNRRVERALFGGAGISLGAVSVLVLGGVFLIASAIIGEPA